MSDTPAPPATFADVTDVTTATCPGCGEPATLELLIKATRPDGKRGAGPTVKRDKIGLCEPCAVAHFVAFVRTMRRPRFTPPPAP